MSSSATTIPMSTLDPRDNSPVGAGANGAVSNTWASKWLLWPLVATLAGAVVLWVLNPKIVQKGGSGSDSSKPDIIKCIIGGALLGLLTLLLVWVLDRRNSADGSSMSSLSSMSWLVIPVVGAIITGFVLWWLKPSVVLKSGSSSEVELWKVVLGSLLVGGILLVLLYTTGFCRP